MAGPLARLYATLGLDTTGFDKGIKKAETTSQKFGQGIMQGLGLGAGLGVATAAAAGIGLVVDGIGDAIDAASDWEEANSKVGVVFDTMADDVRAFADTSASSIGLAENAALDALGTFGNFTQALGITESASADMSKAMVQLAADLGSFNNVGTDEVLLALRSGLSGEAEPMRRFGVALSEAAVTERLLAQGIQKTNGRFTEAQKVQARYELILEQTTKAQGDFARTSDGLANSTKTMNAEITNAQIAIGEKLIPVMLQLVKLARDYVVPALEEVANAFAFITGQGEDTLTVQDLIDKQLTATATAFQRLSGGLTSAATPDAFGLLGFGATVGTAIADAADTLNAPFATFAKEGPETVEQTFADIRNEIKAGFGSVKQALQGPSGIIDPAKRMENMNNRLRAASAKLAEARQVGDTFGIAKWEAAVAKQRINLQDYRRSVKANTDGIVADQRATIHQFRDIGERQGQAQGNAYRRALVDKMAASVNAVIQTIGQTMAMQIINIGNVYGGPTGERELANRLTRAERLARRDRG